MKLLKTSLSGFETQCVRIVKADKSQKCFSFLSYLQKKKTKKIVHNYCEDNF